MLKKVLTYAALTGAASVAAAGITAPPAAASDTKGGDYSQNVNVLPHLCVDVDKINIIQLVDLDLLNNKSGQQCDEIRNGAVKYHEEKGPLSDVLDAGAGNH